MAAYLVVGGLGYAVFAEDASGWDMLRLSSATGGYLVGMLVAATLVGFLADRGWTRKPLLALVAMVLGNVVIYAFGVAWLMHAIDPNLTFAQGWAARRAPLPARRRHQDPARRRPAAGRLEGRRRDPSLTPSIGHEPHHLSRTVAVWSPTAGLSDPPPCPIPARRCRRRRP